MSNALIWPIVVPMAAALLACLSRRYAPVVSTFACVLNLLVCVLAMMLIANHGQQYLLISGWPESLAIALHADPLSIVMLLMTAVIFLLVSIYAIFYVRGREYSADFWPLWMLLLLSLNTMFLSRDLFNIYVALELLGVSAVALAVLQGDKQSLQAGLRYLMLGLLGSLLFLLGVVLIYTRYGTLDWYLLSVATGSDLSLSFALAAMTAGLLLKCALFPLHFWLPNTHANAPAPVSAILSALVVKAAFYLLLRLWTTLGADSLEQITPLLSIMGAIAILWGSVCAFRAKRLKLLAAYSTVAQVGYLFLFLPLIATAAEPGYRQQLFSALLVFMLSHAFAKASLFLAAGYIQHRLGHDHIDRLTGLARTLPLGAFAIGLAGVALIGLPPSGGFIGKWFLLSGAIAASNWEIVLVVMLGTVLAAAYTFRVIGKAFSEPVLSREGDPLARNSDAHSDEVAKFGNTAMILIALILALLATFVIGLFSNPIWQFAGAGEWGK